jgi:sugar O-acyltransferase (sialic acid O-acetyltransferase NeuD family)
MHKTRLLIIGAGGHGASVSEAAQLSGAFEVVGFLDDALPDGRALLNWTVLGAIGDLSNLDQLNSYRRVCDQVIVAVGNNAVREKLTHQLVDAGFIMATVIHPRSFVSPSAVVGCGSAVMAGAILGTQARLGLGSIVNCGAVVDHDARVEDFGHLGVNASMAGGTQLGCGAWLQAGAVLGYGVVIPAGVILAPGQAVGAKSNEYKNENSVKS